MSFPAKLGCVCLIFEFILPLVAYSTQYSKVNILDKCGQKIYLRDTSYKIGFHCERDIHHACAVTLTAPYSHGKIAVRTKYSSFQSKDCKWIDVVDKLTNKSLTAGNSCRERGRSALSTGNSVELIFNFNTPDFKKVAKRYNKIYWYAYVNQYVEKMNGVCPKRQKYHERHKRDHYKKKKQYGYRKDKYFVCDKKKCLDDDLRCDGIRNCDDGMDERFCGMHPRMMCIIIGSCLLTLGVTGVIIFILWRKRSSYMDNTVVTPGDENSKEGEVITYVLPADTEKPAIDPIFCIEAGATGSENVPVALTEAWAEKPPEYPGSKEDMKPGQDAPPPEGINIPTTPPPEYKLSSDKSDQCNSQ